MSQSPCGSSSIVVEGVEGVDGEVEGEGELFPLGPLLLVLVVFALSGVVDTERAVCDPVLGIVSVGGNLPGGDAGILRFPTPLLHISESRSATTLAISCVSSCVISSTLKKNISAEIRSPPGILSSSGSSEWPRSSDLLGASFVPSRVMRASLSTFLNLLG